MKNFTRISVIVVLVILVLVAMDGFYIVDETEQVVLTQFGAPVGEVKTEPGMKMKIPFIQEAHYFDKRYLEWDGDRNQVPTKDKKFIFVDTYARWQITDPLQFFKRLRDERGAQSRLDDILDGETRNAIASHDLVELVRSTNREPIQEGIISEVVEDSLEDISVGRDSIQTAIQQLANKRASDLGLAVLDFRFKRINYVEDVRQTVYDRMVSERQRIAEKFRSEGQGEASRINGEKERELKEIQSEAFRRAEEIRGAADAEAAAVYANAYDKSPQARQLYSFVRSMEAYRNTFDDKTSIVISTNSDFFQFLQDMGN
ncbi:protease modulator HflC [Aliifodinibius sp. S!AR15-10]|uniref:protease modulator HflC n=1 Tax=Aliifodinibius sp. S!AR15-10 TaxID=2950437 RepID=UPI00285D9059|nr:protease modulator HflC [Aliifodinibius sp. S!AR15-10]MDR8392099.1 protease modulator HflC [Aliifodinibius sp. S!AR15-10]